MPVLNAISATTWPPRPCGSDRAGGRPSPSRPGGVGAASALLTRGVLAGSHSGQEGGRTDTGGLEAGGVLSGCEESTDPPHRGSPRMRPRTCFSRCRDSTHRCISLTRAEANTHSHLHNGHGNETDALCLAKQQAETCSHIGIRYAQTPSGPRRIVHDVSHAYVMAMVGQSLEAKIGGARGRQERKVSPEANNSNGDGMLDDSGWYLMATPLASLPLSPPSSGPLDAPSRALGGIVGWWGLWGGGGKSVARAMVSHMSGSLHAHMRSYFSALLPPWLPS